jgi:hypothetical protein
VLGVLYSNTSESVYYCLKFPSNIYKKNSVAWVRERTIPTVRPPLVGEVSTKFADRGCHVVSVTDPCGRILDFLDRSHYFFFQVAPQLYSLGWVDPVSFKIYFTKIMKLLAYCHIMHSIQMKNPLWIQTLLYRRFACILFWCTLLERSLYTWNGMSQLSTERLKNNLFSL